MSTGTESGQQSTRWRVLAAIGESGKAGRPVVLLAVQMHAKPGFKHRLGAQNFRFLQLHPQVQHLAVVVVVPHRRLNLGPALLPHHLRTFFDGVIWLSLEELGQQAELDSLQALLTLPVRLEAEQQASTQQILKRRPDLLSAVLHMFLDRLPHRPAAPYPAAQMVLDRGLLEGKAQGRSAEAAAVAPRARPR